MKRIQGYCFEKGNTLYFAPLNYDYILLMKKHSITELLDYSNIFALSYALQVDVQKTVYKAMDDDSIKVYSATLYNIPDSEWYNQQAYYRVVDADKSIIIFASDKRN